MPLVNTVFIMIRNITLCQESFDFILHPAHQVLVTVLDVNDYRPRFTERVFNTSVFENEPSGTSVITVKATDLDEGENGAILYSMLGPHSGMNTLIKTTEMSTSWLV